MTKETENPEGFIPFDYTRASLAVLISLSRIDSWMELMVKNQVIEMAKKNGEDEKESLAQMDTQFNKAYNSAIEKHLKLAMPGFKMPNPDTGD